MREWKHENSSQQERNLTEDEGEFCLFLQVILLVFVLFFFKSRWLLVLFKVFVLEILKLESTRLRLEAFSLAARRYFYRSHACTWGCLKTKAASCWVKACSHCSSDTKSWHHGATTLFFETSGTNWIRELNAFLSAHLQIKLWIWREETPPRKS